MKCEQFRAATVAGGDEPGNLSEGQHGHLRGCELCRHWFDDARLAAALRELPVADPGPGFADRVIGRAIAAGAGKDHGDTPRGQESDTRVRPIAGRAPRRLTTKLASGGALAATFLVAVLLTTGQVRTPQAADPESRLVNVVIDAQVPRPNATLTLFLADDLELDGYAGRRRIEWQTDLAQGRNLLSLPVQMQSGAPSEMRLAVSYGDHTHQEMRIPVDAW